MKLSVVLPAYNEEDNIKAAVMDVIALAPDVEVIVVNDASTDNTLGVLQSMGLNQMRILTNEKNMGHGYSVVRGLAAANGNWVLYIDADRQIDILPHIPTGYDFYSGWRVHRNDKLFRKFISFCLKMTNLFRHGMYIKDANCPYKLYRRSALQPLLEQLPRTYIIPIACLEVLARKDGLKTFTVKTPHKAYEGTRVGFLQILDRKAMKFFKDAFFEITSI